MSNSVRILHMKKAIGFLTFLLFFCSVPYGQALATDRADKVTTYQDENGWKLLVNGESHYVKGVVWGYTPIGDTYSHDLWSKPEDYIKNVLDYDCKLMKAAGVNTIRSFFNTPPKWVEYIYNEYGIMTIVNHTMGRYGYNVNGIWRPKTDYSDPGTREVLKNDILEVVESFKNTPGVLMFALGNENNYGLEWRSSEIEDLPVGEQHKEKAKHLYSLYNEIIVAAKQIDSNHPYAIVNGDIQYIDLIKEYCTDLDVLGSNVYRGRSFTSMWADVKKTLDLPLVFMEFGSDAFNAKTYKEDQPAQADILRAQWQEIYGKSYGHGQEGNAIGGCVFEWRDEWWKYLQDENLFLHDRNASWSNGGYPFDYVEGVNNMNEEWYGIVQLGLPNEDGVSKAYPRMAYYLLAEVWKADPYTQNIDQINDLLSRIDMAHLALASDVESLRRKEEKRDSFYLKGGNLRVEFLTGAKSNDLDVDGKDGLYFSNGEMIFLDFGFEPSSKLRGDFSINLLGNVIEKQMEIYYSRSRDNNSVELYDFNSTLDMKSYDFTAFYHTPRFHWQYEGDYYGILWEATDIDGMDIWDSKAPYGAEFAGNNALDGLKIVLGPEVYWGANPLVMAKYSLGNSNNQFTLLHSEELARANTSASVTRPTDRSSRSTTAHIKSTSIAGMTVDLAAISASSEKIDELYDYIDDNGDIIYDQINFTDTLGATAKVTVDSFDFGLVYASATYAGLVADGGDPLREFDTLLPYSQFGNKVEFEGGIGFFLGDYTIFPRILYRENLRDANPNIPPTIIGPILNPGTNARNREDDPFAVLDNREALSAEIFFTYDPTPETDFYHWDNANREDANFAFNVGFNYTQFKTPTDSYLFFFEPGNVNAAFGEGLEAEDVWIGTSRMIFNPSHKIRLANRFEVGYQQSTGAPGGPTRRYYAYDFDFDLGRTHNLTGFIKKDQWGPYDFHRQFNVTYPWQFMLDYLYKIDHMMKKVIGDRLGKTAGIGIKGNYRTLDEHSPADEYDGGLNDSMFEITTYLNFEF